MATNADATTAQGDMVWDPDATVKAIEPAPTIAAPNVEPVPDTVPGAASSGGRVLVLVRHAFADAAGGSDPGLSSYGRQQARELGRRLADLGRPARLVTSPLRRAMETAQLIADAQEPRAQLLRERCAAPGHGAAVLGVLAHAALTVVVTHEDVIAAVVTALGGPDRSGYGRASITALSSSSSGWAVSYRPFTDP